MSLGLPSDLFLKYVNVALAWNRKVKQDTPGNAVSSMLTVDLDLTGRKSKGVFIISQLAHIYQTYLSLLAIFQVLYEQAIITHP
jgi:hypothetical protein